MRLAVLGDIHGNLAALEAVLKALRQHAPDLLVVSGDVVDGGPDSALCWERVKSLCCPVIRGNHERYVFGYDAPDADPIFTTEQFAPLRYTIADLSAAQRAELAALPLEWRSPDCPGLLVVHASQRSDADSIWPHTPELEIDPMFSKNAPQLIVRSHNHFCSTRQWRHRQIVTTGAVGLPLDGQPRAQFCLLTSQSGGGALNSGTSDEASVAHRAAWKIEHHNVAYDVAATLRRCHETGYAARGGVIGRLFMREIATGAPQVVPFLRHYHARQKEQPELSLTAAEAEYRAL